MLLQPLDAEELGEDRLLEVGSEASPPAIATGRVSERLVRSHRPPSARGLTRSALAVREDPRIIVTTPGVARAWPARAPRRSPTTVRLLHPRPPRGGPSRDVPRRAVDASPPSHGRLPGSAFRVPFRTASVRPRSPAHGAGVCSRRTRHVTPAATHPWRPDRHPSWSMSHAGGGVRHVAAQTGGAGAASRRRP